MTKAVIQFFRDEQGQDLVEYALIVAAVGLALITTVNTLSQGIASLYSSIPRTVQHRRNAAVSKSFLRNSIPLPRTSRGLRLPKRRILRRLAARSLFAPELALTGAFIAMVWLLVFFGGPSALFRDADAGWHIRAGERMIAAGTFRQGDPFSFSKAGEAWIAWEWASDVLVGTAHRAAGLGGVAFLYMLAIATAVWMWFRLNWAAGGN